MGLASDHVVQERVAVRCTHGLSFFSLPVEAVTFKWTVRRDPLARVFVRADVCGNTRPPAQVIHRLSPREALCCDEYDQSNWKAFCEPTAFLKRRGIILHLAVARPTKCMTEKKMEREI